MSNRLPSPYNSNQQFSTNGQFRNPAGTNPLPQPTNMPAACWFGNRQVLNNWKGEPTYDWEMDWQSPIFDLQPQLRGLQSQSTTGINQTILGGQRYNTGGNAVPIWGRGALHVQISNLLATVSSLTNLKVLVREFSHIGDSGQVTQVLPEADITQSFNTKTNSIILHFHPLGEGSFVRFWQVRLKFYRPNTDPLTDNPTFYIDSGFY